MARLEFFSESRIQLAKEVKLHPELMERIQNHRQEDFEIILAEIAAYCDIVLHGNYYPEDLDNLCEILYWKLRKKRSPLVIVTH